MQCRRLLLVLAVGSSLACGATAVELPEWFVTVPEGTPLREYPELPPPSAASEAVELVPDLVLGERTEDPAYRFYGPSWVDVAADGRIFVADFGNHRIQVFGPDGAYLETLGRRGQGPGEFQFATYVILEIAGGRIFVSDRGNRRLSVWSTGGEHLEDAPFPRDGVLNGFEAVEADVVVGRLIQLRDEALPPGWQRHVVTLYPPGGASRTLLEQGVPPDPRSDALGAGVDVLRASPEFAVYNGDATVYVSPRGSHQVFAFTADGTMRWALRSAREPLPYPAEEKNDEVERLRERGIPAGIDDFEWPETLPAIFALEVDGHGHLYVFRYDVGTLRREHTADVYDRDGRHLFSGPVTGAPFRWNAALGDHVYGWQGLEDGNSTVVRYRIVEPFD